MSLYHRSFTLNPNAMPIMSIRRLGNAILAGLNIEAHATFSICNATNYSNDKLGANPQNIGKGPAMGGEWAFSIYYRVYTILMYDTYIVSTAENPLEKFSICKFLTVFHITEK